MWSPGSILHLLCDFTINYNSTSFSLGTTILTLLFNCRYQAPPPPLLLDTDITRGWLSSGERYAEYNHRHTYKFTIWCGAAWPARVSEWMVAGEKKRTLRNSVISDLQLIDDSSHSTVLAHHQSLALRPSYCAREPTFYYIHTRVRDISHRYHNWYEPKASRRQTTRQIPKPTVLNELPNRPCV